MANPRKQFGELFQDIWICLGEVPTATLVRKCATAWPRSRRAELIDLLRTRAQQFIAAYPSKVAALDLLIGQLMLLDEEAAE